MTDFSALGKLGGRPRRPMYYILTKKDVMQEGDEVYDSVSNDWSSLPRHWWGRYHESQHLLRRRVSLSRLVKSLGKKLKERPNDGTIATRLESS